MKLTVTADDGFLPGKTFELPDDFCEKKGITKRSVSIHEMTEDAWKLTVDGKHIWIPKSMCRFIDISNHTFDNFMESVENEEV